MKNVIWWFCTVILMIGGYHKSNSLPLENKQATSIVKPFCDDLPITLHTHVKNSSGIAISGASVTLTLFGTSTPTYSGTTNSTGDCTLSSVNQGSYHYKISATGYNDKTADLSLHTDTNRTDTLTSQ